LPSRVIYRLGVSIGAGIHTVGIWQPILGTIGCLTLLIEPYLIK